MPLFQPRTLAKAAVFVAAVEGVNALHAHDGEPHPKHHEPGGPEQIPGPRALMFVGTGTTQAIAPGGSGLARY